MLRAFLLSGLIQGRIFLYDPFQIDEGTQMKDRYKTKDQLLKELEALRKQVSKMEKIEKKRKRAEGKLQESEKKYRTLVEYSLQGIVIGQGPPPPHLVFANQAMGKILGYPPDKLTSLSPQETEALVHPEDRELFFNRFADRLEGKPVPSHYEVRGIRKDGAVVWLELSSARIKYRRQYAVQATFIDITERKQMEEVLRESEEKYRHIFETSPMGIGLSTLDGKMATANKAMEDIMGYSAEELKKIGLVNTYENKEDRNALLKSLYQNGRVVDYPIRLKRKDGTPYDALLSMLLIDIGGKRFFHTICRDITERKQAEEALRESRERFAKVFHSSPIPICISTLEESRFIDVNNSSLNMFGYNREELIGHTAIEVGMWVNPEDRDQMLQTLSSKGSARNMETSLRTKSGDILSVLYSMEPIDIGGERCLLAFAMNITDRKRAEEILRKSEENYRGLIESSPEVIYVLSAEDGTFTYLNLAFERVTGWSCTKWLGRSFTGITHPDDLPLADEHFQQMLRGESTKPFKIRIQTNSGEYIMVEIIGMPRIKNGEVVGMIGFVRDVTEREGI